MDSHPRQVALEVRTPSTYDRPQLLVRLLVACSFAAIHQSLGGLFGSLYLLLPVVAAVLISQHGPSDYVQRDGPKLLSLLEWVIGLYAYMLFVTDRFPLGPTERDLRLRVTPTGTPTLPNALARLITSLPHLVLLFVFSLLSALASLVMAVTVLVSQTVPEALRQFQQGLLGWVARVFVYHGSLATTYPPFSLGQGALPPPPPHSEAHGGSAA